MEEQLWIHRDSLAEAANSEHTDIKDIGLMHCISPMSQSVKEHSVKLSRNSKVYAAVEKTGKNAVKSRAVPAPCC